MADETYYEQTVSVEITKDVVAESEGDARQKAVTELNDEFDDGRRFEIRESTIVDVGDVVDVEPTTDESDENESEDKQTDDSVDLPDDYGELQDLAKENDIPANQSTEDLKDALREEMA